MYQNEIRRYSSAVRLHPRRAILRRKDERSIRGGYNKDLFVTKEIKVKKLVLHWKRDIDMKDKLMENETQK